MANHGLKENLVRYLASHNEWRAKGYLLSLQWKYYGENKVYMPDTVSRELRSSEEEKRIAVKSDGKSVQYKFIPPNLRNKYIPFSERKEKDVLWKK